MKALSVKPLWFKFEDYDKYLQNVKAVTYAFAFCDVKPKNNIWPFQLEEVFYIGESATTEPTVDRKNKNKPDKGKIQWAPFTRFKSHMSKMLNASKYKDDVWCRTFTESFGCGIDVVKGTLTGKACYICVLVCPNDVKYPKSWVKRVEQEMIDEYLNAFDCVPICNTREKNGSSDSMKKENSLSQILLKEYKANDVTRFAVN